MGNERTISAIARVTHKWGCAYHDRLEIQLDGRTLTLEEIKGYINDALARSERTVVEFEKVIEIQPPYDKRHDDPKKNYGIHGMTLRFILKGPKGATQFVYYTCQHLEHVADEFYFGTPRQYNPFKGMGADIGYHSPKPMYEGQTPMECDVLGGQCYYDGTSLGASEFAPTFLREGTDAVWKMLERRYRDTFERQEAA